MKLIKATFNIPIYLIMLVILLGLLVDAIFQSQVNELQRTHERQVERDIVRFQVPIPKE